MYKQQREIQELLGSFFEITNSPFNFISFRERAAAEILRQYTPESTSLHLQKITKKARPAGLNHIGTV